METKIEGKLEFLDVLKLAAKLLCGNIGLVVFSCFVSLPLFCFFIFFEPSLQNTRYLVSEYLFQQGYTFRNGVSLLNLPEPGEAVAPKMIQTCLLYFFPYHLLDFFATTAIIGASSTAYMSEERMGLGLLVRRSVEIGRRRFSGCLITSLYVLLFSTSVLFGFISAAMNYYFCVYLLGGHYDHVYTINFNLDDDYHSQSVSSVNFLYYDGLVGLLSFLVVVLLHGALFVVLAAKFNQWSSVWNMGLVVSVLEAQAENEEGVYGSDALSLSACYSRGHETQGLWLMLVFFVNALALRLPCFYSKCSGTRIGVLYTCVYAGLICVGNVFKWVACVVFYHESRTRVLEKKADLEVGARAKPSAT